MGTLEFTSAIFAAFVTVESVSSSLFCSSNIQCAVERQTVCNGTCRIPNIHGQCPCSAVNVSCQGLSKICVEVMFEDQELRCRDWRSNNSCAFVLGSKDHTSACINSTAVMDSEDGLKVWCYKDLFDPIPVEILLMGPNVRRQELCHDPLETYTNGSEVTIKVILHINSSGPSHPLLTPRHCICPRKNYSCLVTSALGLAWHTPTTMDELQHLFADDFLEAYVVDSGFAVAFRKYPGGNFSSSIHVQDLEQNGTNLTCQGLYLDEADSLIRIQSSVAICCIGAASSPRDLSVVWDDPYAVVSFQSPVYGGECVEYYVVTAVSEEEGRNISCNATSDGDRYNCSILLDGSANDYNFTVYGVTPVNDSFRLIGESVTACYLLFPENATATESECGVNTTLNLTWEGRYENTTVSWRRVNSSGTTHYERADSEDYYLLTLDYSENGQVAIAVTFSSPVCNKTTITNYTIERILMSVSLKYPILVIESSDCITSPENYRIVVTSTDSPSNELVNVSFNTTIEHNVGAVVRLNTQYTIRVQLVHISSNNTIIDEMIETILYSSPTPTPSPGVTEVTPTTTDDGDLTTVIVAVLVCMIGLVLVGAVVTMIVMVIFIRKKQTKADKCVDSSFATEMSGVNPIGGVVYETVGVGGNTGPDTSENVAYAATTTPSTLPNPSYEPLPREIPIGGVVYETVGLGGNTGPDTSENVAYAATTTPSTLPNPAYEAVVKRNRVGEVNGSGSSETTTYHPT